jgi:hypothetical protein
MLLSQRNSKTQSFLNKKVAVFIRNRTNKQLWQKSHNSVLIAKIQHFVSITNINNESQIYWCNGLTKKHLSGVVSNLEPIHNVMALWSHQSIIFPFTQQNENENCLWALSKQKLNKQILSFPMSKTTKEKLQQTTFRIILLFRQQK